MKSLHIPDVLFNPQISIYALGITFLFLLSKFWSQRSQLFYPPGPRGLWYFGLRKYPTKKPWLTYLEWGRKYGDLIHFTRFGRHYLIINSLEAANEILDKNARFTSDRPSTLPLDKISEWGRFLSLMSYSDEWRKNRKLFHQSFRAEAAHQFYPVQKQQIEKFILEIVSSKSPLLDQITTLSQRIMFNAMYNLNISTNREDLPQHAREVLEVADYRLIPGYDGINNVPFIHLIPSWFPGGHLKTFYQRFARELDESVEGPWNLMMSTLGSDENYSSLLLDLMSKSDMSDVEIGRIKNMGAQGISAASDTTMSAIATFFLAMSLYPHVQIKAQQELDNVLGERIPSFEDRPSLPYIEAIYREVMRWHPAIPLGLPHITTADLHYGQYYIPKGTSIYANIWAMTHNPSLYPEPDQFIPERHLHKDGHFESINSILAYGFGRRVCIGRYMANDTIWLAIACVLATIKISSIRYGDVEDHYTDGTFCSPKSLDFNVNARTDSQFWK